MPMSIARIRKVPLLSGGKLHDFEERIMFGDLDALIEEMARDRNVSDELVHGLESLRHFRAFYAERRAAMNNDDRARLAAYDASWCMELIEMAQRERGYKYQRS